MVCGGSGSARARVTSWSWSLAGPYAPSIFQCCCSSSPEQAFRTVDLGAAGLLLRHWPVPFSPLEVPQLSVDRQRRLVVLDEVWAVGDANPSSAYLEGGLQSATVCYWRPAALFVGVAVGLCGNLVALG